MLAFKKYREAETCLVLFLGTSKRLYNSLRSLVVVVVVLAGGETSFVKKSLKGEALEEYGEGVVQRGKVSTSRDAG
jgi:hypothetical protein